jgi:small GTP-binding protein
MTVQWDTAGDERFHTITHSYYRGSDGIILVYDVTERSSFDDLQQYWKEARQHCSVDVNMQLVGTKCDLVGERQVEYDEGEAFASARGMSFLEASAAADENVDRGKPERQYLI